MKNKLNRCRYTLTAVLLLSGLLLTGCDSLLPDGQTTVESTETDYPADQPEETTEAALPEPVPPTVIEGFSEESLSLFSAEQGALSVSEDGALVLNAEWNDGDPNRSYLIFDPVSVMKAADSEAKASPEAVLLKVERVMALPNTPTAEAGHDTFGRLTDLEPLPTYRHATSKTPYEYIVIDVSADSLQKGLTPYVYLEWLCMEDKNYSSEGRSLTIREISFHGNVWDAFLAVKADMTEDGVKQTAPNYWYGDDYVLFDRTPIRTPFLFLEPAGPNGEPIPAIKGESFTNSDTLTVAILEEGFTHFSNRCLAVNENLQAVYLPDSLEEIMGDPFVFCPKLTRIRIGKGIRTIDGDAIPFSDVTDIDYNGTMAQWCQVDRGKALGSGRVMVHCLDGDIPYAATSPDEGKADENAYDLAWSTPLELAEGQILLQMESTRLTLTHKNGIEKDVILRWAMTRMESPTPENPDNRNVFYFDILSPEDGSLLYALSPEEIAAFTRFEGSSIWLSRGAAEENMPKTATLFLAGYGFEDAGNSFRVKLTHFHVELEEDGGLKVNREADAKLTRDVTVSFPLTGYGDLNKTRQIFRDAESYIVKTHDLGNLNPSYVLLVNRPHGDGAIRNLRTSPSSIDGFFFNAMWQSLTPDIFNEKTLAYLYDCYGAYKVRK